MNTPLHHQPNRGPMCGQSFRARSVPPARARAWSHMVAVWSLCLSVMSVGWASGCASDVTRESAVGEATQDDAITESTGPTSKVDASRITNDVSRRVVMVPWIAGRGEGGAGGGRGESSTSSSAPSQSSSAERLTIIRQRRDEPNPDGHGVAPTSWHVRRFRTSDGTGVTFDAGIATEPTPAPIREQHIVLTEGGSIALSSEVNRVEGVVVEFEPPMYVLPARLPLDGQQCVYENIRMVVRPLADRTLERASGKVRHSVCYEADETLRTPAGEFRAHRLVSRFSADLGASKIENVTTQWYVLGVGLIAERRHEQTWALGIRIRNNREGWIAAEVDTQLAGAAQNPFPEGGGSGWVDPRSDPHVSATDSAALEILNSGSHLATTHGTLLP